jgi:hypothetical protein
MGRREPKCGGWSPHIFTRALEEFIWDRTKSKWDPAWPFLETSPFGLVFAGTTPFLLIPVSFEQRHWVPAFAGTTPFLVIQVSFERRRWVRASAGTTPFLVIPAKAGIQSSFNPIVGRRHMWGHVIATLIGPRPAPGRRLTSSFPRTPDNEAVPITRHSRESGNPASYQQRHWVPLSRGRRHYWSSRCRSSEDAGSALPRGRRHSWSSRRRPGSNLLSIR